MRTFVTVVMTASVVTGCATMTRDLDQNIGLTAPGCSGPVTCTFANKKGSWTAQAPGMVSVRRSDDPLRVWCEAGSRFWQGEVGGEPAGRTWLGTIVGGAIGAMVDASTDAHWDYPAAIAVPICTEN